MKPRKVCSFPGCPILAIPGNHRCQRHYEPWAGKSWSDNPWSTPEGKRLRSKVLREEPQCRVCGRPSTSVDHIIPRSRGGPMTRENLQGLCSICHRAKTQREATEGKRLRRDP